VCQGKVTKGGGAELIGVQEDGNIAIASVIVPVEASESGGGDEERGNSILRNDKSAVGILNDAVCHSEAVSADVGGELVREIDIAALLTDFLEKKFLKRKIRINRIIHAEAYPLSSLLPTPYNSISTTPST